MDYERDNHSQHKFKYPTNPIARLKPGNAWLFSVLYLAGHCAFLCSMQNPQPKLSDREIAQAWAKITIIKWKKKLAINKVGNSGALLQSFQYNVLASAQGNVLKITLLFEYYGRFVDMGVGRGVKIGDVKESATSRRLSGKMLGNRRRPKKWYSKTFHAEVMKLSEIFAKEYGHRGVIAITENVSDKSIGNG
jgi:hypothetical protein